MHSHNFYELIVVMSGRGCHYIGEMSFPISQGDVFVIPPGVAHGYYCEESEELNICYFLFRTEFMKRYYSDILTVPGATTLFELEPYLRQVYESKLFLHISGNDFERLKEQITEITSHNSEPYSAYYDFSVLYTVGLLCCLMNAQNKNIGRLTSADKEILGLLNYIGEHFDERLTVTDICKISNMSRATLHRRFKAVTKLSPMEYIMRLRLKEVKNLIEASELSKTAIAQIYGFYDASHMQKCLKEYESLL